MAGEVFAGIGAFKAAIDIAKTLKDMDSATSRNTAIIDIQTQVLSAQAAQMALIQRVDYLEKQVANFEAWESEKQRYELKELYVGFFAYILKEPERTTATHHAICANCYERRQKSFLQSNGNGMVVKHRFFCPSCNTEYACPPRQISELIGNLDKIGSF